RARSLAREQSAGELPVADVGGQRDKAVRESAHALGALEPGHMGGQTVDRLSVGRHQIAEAHREVGEGAERERLESRPRGPGDACHGRPDRRALHRHQRGRQTPERPREAEPQAPWKPTACGREAVEARPVVRVRVPPPPGQRPLFSHRPGTPLRNGSTYCQLICTLTFGYSGALPSTSTTRNT